MMATEYAIEARAPLVVKWRRREIRITRVNRRTARQRHVRERRAAIILQRPNHRIGIDLVARPVQVAAATITADIVSMRRHRTPVVENIFEIGRASCRERV